jgi:hypothetical protein
MKSNFQKSNGLDAIIKSTRQQFFWKYDLNFPKILISVIDLTSMDAINLKNSAL